MPAAHHEKVETEAKKPPQKTVKVVKHSKTPNLTTSQVKRLIRNRWWHGFVRRMYSRFIHEQRWGNAPVCEGLQSRNSLPTTFLVARGLRSSLSTVHDIIKKFRESREMSLRKGREETTTLSASDVRSLPHKTFDESRNDAKTKVSCSPMCPRFKIDFDHHGHHIFQAKEENTLPDCSKEVSVCKRPILCQP